jgi:hypothetical protein
MERHHVRGRKTGASNTGLLRRKISKVEQITADVGAEIVLDQVPW